MNGPHPLTVLTGGSAHDLRVPLRTRSGATRVAAASPASLPIERDVEIVPTEWMAVEALGLSGFRRRDPATRSHHVLRDGRQLQVSGRYAAIRAALARMVDRHAFGDVADEQFVRQPVRVPLTTPIRPRLVELPVSTAVRTSPPGPARSGGIDLVHEPR